MPAPVVPEPRAPDPNPNAATGGAEPVERSRPAAQPDGRAATDRLQALLRDDDSWRDRLADLLAASRAGGVPGRAVVVVVVAIGLGAGAFVALGGGRGPAADPAQVLPRVGVVGAAPLAGSTSSPGAVPSPAPPGTTVVAAPPGTEPTTVLVHAAGAVAVPGVHRVPADARVADLIVAAGGLTAEADPDRINLAAALRDGERVYVPRRGEAVAPDVVAGRGEPLPGGDPGTALPSGPAGPAPRVDLNTADVAALEALPGIGPTTAAAIIGHRAEHGPFTSVDQLQDVTGIGPAKFATLRDLVRV